MTSTVANDAKVSIPPSDICNVHHPTPPFTSVPTGRADVEDKASRRTKPRMHGQNFEGVEAHLGTGTEN